MSQPPRTNPDARRLPPGWITQFDANYDTWFYVDTFVQPPVTTWTHPLGAPPSPTAAYGSPQGPPPGQGSPQQQGSPSAGEASPYPGKASPSPGPASPHPQQQSTQPPPQQHENPPQVQGGKGAWSGLLGGKVMYDVAQPPPQKQEMGLGLGGKVVYDVAQPPPQKTSLALGAGGLLGGVLIAEGFDEEHDGEDDKGFFERHDVDFSDLLNFGGDDGGWGDGGGDGGGGD
ncbi:hypothetical protein C8R45DRAFT_1162186 [Mycena sanguinolenta]|nr:hypothetical protein C8R45DRAFT_1162186 [Mycena sanguinolenta]